MPGPDLEAALKDILELLLLFLSYLKHPSTHTFPREAAAAQLKATEVPRAWSWGRRNLGAVFMDSGNFQAPQRQSDSQAQAPRVC